MTSFTYRRALTVADALAAAADPAARFLGGGTSLVDLMKVGVETPAAVIDLTRVPELAAITPRADGGLTIGATVRMAALTRAAGPWPVLRQALLAGATPQIRNAATVAGNLLQGVRCFYFRDPSFPCNKRTPGSGCPARDGVNAGHAVLGWSDGCVAVHPSDLAVALVALDAAVRVRGPAGERAVPLDQFLRLPGDRPDRIAELEPGELVTAVDIPPPGPGDRSAYAKVPPAGGFAVASAAVALTLDAGVVRSARVVLGGVAHKPWRAAAAEAALVGRAPDAAAVGTAARAAVTEARPLARNAFKVKLAEAVVAEAVREAAR